MDARLDIFLVEDHEDTTTVLCDLLRDWGHNVRVASTVSAAREALSQWKGDLLISDIRLPDGDGWQLMEALGPKAPPCAVAMSGLGTEADQARSLQAGYRKHLVKPFDAVVLQRLLLDVTAEIRRTKPTGPLDRPSAH